jgi:hypothetical protein
LRAADNITAMPPAAAKAPFDYLFALVVGLIVIGVSFKVEPSTTRYIVLGVGILMAITVLLVALRPTRH